MSLEKLNVPADSVYAIIDSPVGPLIIAASKRGLHSVIWKDIVDPEEIKDLRESPRHPLIVKTAVQLKEYFNGRRKHFDIPIDIFHGTNFQKSAWESLTTIPYGETISYQEQAKRVGDSKKARAVGLANSKNPISIIVPCHRVIGKNGSLTGFGGGLDSKKFLIDHELTHS